MKKFKAPFITPNEDRFEIKKIFIKNGDYVKKKQLVFLVETIKTALEIESEENGYIYFNFSIGDSIICGEYFYEISNERILKKRIIENEERVITEEANKIIAEQKINIKDIKDKIVDKESVLKYLKVSKVKKTIPVGNNDSLLIVGCSMHGRVVYEATIKQKKYIPVAFVDYSNTSNKNTVYKLNIFEIDDIETIFENGTKNIFINTNNIQLTKSIHEKAKKIGYDIVNIIHPSAEVSETATLGESIFIGAQAIIGTNVKIGSFSKILNKASVAHDSIIKENVQISDGATVAGNVVIEDNVMIGINVGIINKCKIGKNSTIISGKIVINDIPENTKK
jgi:sugar O-acyltransferase (sialic acid O-acetyltransferase NeuD family)